MSYVAVGVIALSAITVLFVWLAAETPLWPVSRPMPHADLGDPDEPA